MAALDWSQCPAVESTPGKVSGAWVFKGTRLPVATVIENLEDLSVDEVMEQCLNREVGMAREAGQCSASERRRTVRLPRDPFPQAGLAWTLLSLMPNRLRTATYRAEGRSRRRRAVEAR